MRPSSPTAKPYLTTSIASVWSKHWVWTKCSLMAHRILGSSDSGRVNFIAPPESDEPNKEPLIRTSVRRRGLDPRTLGLKVASSPSCPCVSVH